MSHSSPSRRRKGTPGVGLYSYTESSSPPPTSPGSPQRSTSHTLPASYLEHIEGVVLNGRVFGAQEIHEHLEVSCRRYKPKHYLKVDFIDQEVAKHLEVRRAHNTHFDYDTQKNVLVAQDQVHVPAKQLLLMTTYERNFII